MKEIFGHQCCPRRIEDGRAPRSAEEPLWPLGQHGDTWEPGDQSCSYCGSFNPDALMVRLEAGDIEVGPTDKNYKIYLRNNGGAPLMQTHRKGRGEALVTEETSQGKFYLQHFSPEQRLRFLQLYNEGKIKLGYPGHLYVAPYFARRMSDDEKTQFDPRDSGGV